MVGFYASLPILVVVGALPGVVVRRVRRAPTPLAGVGAYNKPRPDRAAQGLIPCGRCGTRPSLSSMRAARAPCSSLGLAIAAVIRTRVQLRERSSTRGPLLPRSRRRRACVVVLSVSLVDRVPAGRADDAGPAEQRARAGQPVKTERERLAEAFARVDDQQHQTEAPGRRDAGGDRPHPSGHRRAAGQAQGPRPAGLPDEGRRFLPVPAASAIVPRLQPSRDEPSASDTRRTRTSSCSCARSARSSI